MLLKFFSSFVLFFLNKINDYGPTHFFFCTTSCIFLSQKYQNTSPLSEPVNPDFRRGAGALPSRILQTSFPFPSTDFWCPLSDCTTAVQLIIHQSPFSVSKRWTHYPTWRTSCLLIQEFNGRDLSLWLRRKGIWIVRTFHFFLVS